MVQTLSKFFIIIFILSCQKISCQVEKNVYNNDDYKNKDQFEKFQKRRKIVGAWQINQLKKGALVIKLKTNKTLITELIKAGNIELAEKKKLETFIINKNIVAAYRDNLNFCKIYFMYSNSADSLLNGVRRGIFLDSNLVIDPTIEMPEKFYLVAEKDNVYNSSIGFVTEDSARVIKEHGNPSGQLVDIVIKNKYGHQLKKPFPYECGFGYKGGAYDVSFVKNIPIYYFETDKKYDFNIDKTQLIDFKNNPKKEFKKQPKEAKVFMLDKQYGYEAMSAKVNRFNEYLNSYYKSSPNPEMDKISKEIIPFLY
jgi:hypothetical protein